MTDTTTTPLQLLAEVEALRDIAAAAFPAILTDEWDGGDFQSFDPSVAAYLRHALNAFPALAQALRAALAASEAIVARVEAVDPLAVAADWDEGDAIAAAVHKACVQAAKAKGV